MILAQKQTYGLMKQNTELRNKPSHVSPHRPLCSPCGFYFSASDIQTLKSMFLTVFKGRVRSSRRNVFKTSQDIATAFNQDARTKKKLQKKVIPKQKNKTKHKTQKLRSVKTKQVIKLITKQIRLARMITTKARKNK